ncbi:hypothetical protein GGI12_002443 [Dipsacomyces acuminosporus]|nr:hypothetical protein GGI12_002443 [Dipsacomyces acuminosporus]
MRIGRFVVVDDAVADEEDALTNFFVAARDVGRPRAQCIVETLCELNPAVHGSAVVKSAEDALATDPADTIGSASLVIACGLPEDAVRQISEICWNTHKPLICTSTAGFAARLRTSVPEHAALLEYAEGIDFDSLDACEIGHVPCVIIILKALTQWFAINSQGNSTIRNITIPYKSKGAIRELIRKAAPSVDEENFQEACAGVSGYCVPYKIPGEVDRILNDPSAISVSAQSDKFWILAHSLRSYVQSKYSQGQLPLSGAIPDMKSDTKGYIALQRIYKTKADQDRAEMSRKVHETLQAAGLPLDYISADEVDTFCKNAHFLRLLRYTPIHKELDSGPAQPSALAGSDALSHYILFRASDIFHKRNGRYPGVPGSMAAENSTVCGDARNDTTDIDALVSADTVGLSEIAKELLALWQVDSEVSADVAAEFVRSGHCELHNIASITGGLVSQEAIKLITHQYVPVNNLCIVDGAKSRILAATV